MKAARQSARGKRRLGMVRILSRGRRVTEIRNEPSTHKGQHFDCGYRLDLLIEGKVIVEVKSVREFAPVHPQQLLTYLKVTGNEVGLVINFNVPVLKDGVRRVMNSTALEGSASSATGPREAR